MTKLLLLQEKFHCSCQTLPTYSAQQKMAASSSQISLSFSVTKRKQNLFCRNVLAYSIALGHLSKSFSQRNNAFKHSNKQHFTERGNWLRTIMWAFEIVPAYQAQKKTKIHPTTLGKDVRIKDRLHERCPKWVETERRNLNVRKQHGMVVGYSC